MHTRTHLVTASSGSDGSGKQPQRRETKYLSFQILSGFFGLSQLELANMLKTGQLQEMWVVASQTHLQFNMVRTATTFFCCCMSVLCKMTFHLTFTVLAGCVHGLLPVACNHGSHLCAYTYKACVSDQLPLL